jgi:hypothetical protein
VVDLAAGGFELGGFFAHACGEGFFGFDVLGVGVIADVPGYLDRLHRTKMSEAGVLCSAYYQSILLFIFYRVHGASVPARLLAAANKLCPPHVHLFLHSTVHVLTNLRRRPMQALTAAAHLRDY